MHSIINTKPLFYDYFPHISVMRLKNDFNLGYYEQCEIRTRIQRVIKMAYERLLDIHDLHHANVYQEIGEEFDDNFYHELKDGVTQRFHSATTWEFLDDLMPVQEIADDSLNANFQTKMLTILGYGLPRSQSTCRINLKEALVALFNYDLDPLSGQELLHLTRI